MERDELRELIRETVAEVLRQQRQQQVREHLARVKAEVRGKFARYRPLRQERPDLLAIARGTRRQEEVVRSCRFSSSTATPATRVVAQLSSTPVSSVMRWVVIPPALVQTIPSSAARRVTAPGVSPSGAASSAFRVGW